MNEQTWKHTFVHPDGFYETFWASNIHDAMSLMETFGGYIQLWEW